MRDCSEDIFVEQPATALHSGLGWKTANCYDEVYGIAGDASPARLYGENNNV